MIDLSSKGVDMVMDKIYIEDFNMAESNPNGQFVKISEINEMIKYGVIFIDRQKLKEYHASTRTIK